MRTEARRRGDREDEDSKRSIAIKEQMKSNQSMPAVAIKASLDPSTQNHKTVTLITIFSCRAVYKG